MRRETSKNAIAFVGFILLHGLPVCQSFFTGQTACQIYNVVIAAELDELMYLDKTLSAFIGNCKSLIMGRVIILCDSIAANQPSKTVHVSFNKYQVNASSWTEKS